MRQSAWYKNYLKLFNDLNKKKLVFFYGKYNRNEIHQILCKSNLALHLKYKDPCPNAVIEKLQYGIPFIYSNSGGTPELIKKAGIPINVKDVWSKMQSVDYKILSKKIILAKKHYKILSKEAFKQSKNFNFNRYAIVHKKIFNQLN